MTRKNKLQASSLKRNTTLAKIDGDESFTISSSDADCFSSDVLPVLSPLPLTTDSPTVPQSFAVSFSAHFLVAITLRDMCKLRLHPNIPDSTRVAAILSLIATKICATGFEARVSFEDTRKGGLCHPTMWTVSPSPTCNGFGFADAAASIRVHKALRHVGATLTSPAFLDLHRSQRPKDPIQIDIIMSHLARTLEVFEPIRSLPMPFRLFKRSFGQQGVAPYEPRELASIGAAGVRYEVALQELIDGIVCPDLCVWAAHSNRERSRSHAAHGSGFQASLASIDVALRTGARMPRDVFCQEVASAVCPLQWHVGSHEVRRVVVPLGTGGDAAFVDFDTQPFRLQTPLQTRDGSFAFLLRGTTEDAASIARWSAFLEAFVVAALHSEGGKETRDGGKREGAEAEKGLADLMDFVPSAQELLVELEHHIRPAAPSSDNRCRQ